jgi:large subunit ribosomal protein L22
MEARASIRNVPIAPRKARLVASLVRHQYVEAALNQLTFTLKAASPVIHKLIQSALANARSNAQKQGATIDESNLFVKRITIDDGVTRRWFRPRARGMANRILRRRCHIIVVLDEERGEDGD